MITERDKDIISFIESIGFASIKNIADMFFVNNRYKYDSARKRLKILSEKNGYLKCFQNCDTKELIYVPIQSKLKKVSMHSLKVLEYLCNLKLLGCNIKDVELEPVFDNIKPDAYICFEFNSCQYYQLLEVQMRHDFVDINRFNNQNVINEIYNKTNNVGVKIIIVQDTQKNYNENNESPFEAVQLYTSMEDVAKVLI